MKAAATLVAMVLAVNALAGNTVTPEALADQFIGAVNAKSAEKQRALIHPRCLSELSAIQKQFIDETLARDFRRTIPEKRTVKVTSLDGPDVPFAGAVAWPIRPTHQIEIEFSTGENASASVIRFIAKEKDAWLIIIPMLTEENLKKYAEKNATQQGAVPLPHASQAGHSEGVR